MEAGGQHAEAGGARSGVVAGPYGYGPDHGSPPSWWSSPTGPATDRRRGGGPFVAVVSLLLVVAVAALVARVVTAVGPGSGVSASRHSAVRGDVELARQIDLTRADFPPGWTAGVTEPVPLSTLLTGTADAGWSGTQLAASYEHCMGVGPLLDPVFGRLGGAPTAAVVSPIFDEGDRTMDDVAASVRIFATSSPVAAGVSQVQEPRFTHCFAAGVTALVGGTASGSPRIESVTPLEDGQPGAAMAGADVVLGVGDGRLAPSVEVVFAVVGGGRAEVQLVAVRDPAGWPSSLTTSLTDRLESKVSELGNGTGL
ncbi:MAG TPA: hypothetical protein VK277_16575 [Acidimicrobiales bacterium]|nr:hypothetical protein [Acidimicrobiales bacterium]